MSSFGLAFLKALHPEYNRFQIQAQMMSQANRPGGPGWDDAYGYGVVDMAKAGDAVNFAKWSMQIESPARNSAVTGETPLIADVNPKVVANMVVKDETGRIVANLPNVKGDYLLRGRFDANMLGAGPHTLSFVAYDARGTAVTTRTLALSVRPPNQTGLQIKVLDPLGRSAKAWISVFHRSTVKYLGKDMSVYEYVWAGETNDAGDLQLSNALLHDGNDFILYANLAFTGPDGAGASAMYTRTVSPPGRIVLDGINAHPVRFAAKRLKDDGSVAPMDDGYVLALVSDAAGNGEGIATTALASLEGNGTFTAWMEPGTYNLAATSWSYNHFLYLPQVQVTQYTRRIDFNVDQVSQMTFAGDHSPYLYAGIALFNGSNMEPLLDVTKNHTITFTPGYYQAEIVAEAEYKGNMYVYYLVDGLDPMVNAPQPGALYEPGTRRVIHDGNLVEPLMQNQRSYQVPATDYYAVNKFTTTSNLWLYFGYWFGQGAGQSLAQSLSGGPVMLHRVLGQEPRLDRLGVPGVSRPQQLEFGALGSGYIEPTFTVSALDGSVITQSTSFGNLWWSWWPIPSAQAPGLYLAQLDLASAGPLGGPVHTETAIDVRKDGVSSGLRVSVLGLDGKPSPSPWVEILRKSVLPNGQSFYNFVAYGYADYDGVMRFDADPTFLPDGNEYVVLAFHGSWDATPPFLLTQTVVTPADIVFDARTAQPITVTTQDENGSPLGGGVVALTAKDGAGVLLDSFYGAYTPSNGQVKILLTDAAKYELSTWNFGRNYYLTSPTLTIDSSLTSYTIPTDKLARVTVGAQTQPDGQPAAYGVFYPNFKGTYMWGVFNPGTTVTMTASEYELQDMIIAYTQSDLWVYWLDTPDGHLRANDNLTLNFGGPLQASLQAVQSYLNKGQFFAYTDVRDQQHNILIAELGVSFGSEEANLLTGKTDLAHVDLDTLNRIQMGFKRMQARRQLALALGPAIAEHPELPTAQTHSTITPNLRVYDQSGKLVTTVHDVNNNWQFLYWAPPAGAGGSFTARLILPVDGHTDITADASFRLPGLSATPGRFSPRQGSLKVHLDLMQKGTVDVQVQKSDGTPVANLINDQTLSAGGYDMAWNGRVGSGYAPDGSYVVVATMGETGQQLVVPFSLKASIPQRPTLDAPPAFTNLHTARISGRTSPGAHVEFWVDGRVSSTVDPTDANGEGFFVGNVPLAEHDGTYFITAVAYDDYSNRSSYASAVRVTLDTVPPTIVVQRPALGAGGTVSTDGTRLSLQGSTEGHSTVVLTITAPDGRVSSRTYQTGYSGRFSDTISLPDVGDYQLRLVATDQASNIGDPVSFTVHRNG